MRQNTVVDEHKQALLADDELSPVEIHHYTRPEPIVSPQQHGTLRRSLWLVLAPISLALLAFLSLLGIRLSPLATHGALPSASQVISHNEYKLGAGWDYASIPRLREYDWSLEEVEFNPDGVYRTMLLINKSFPGPLIEANEGDTIRVTIRNNMSNSTAVHWHGIYQNGTNPMDGTIGITQCPIAPGQTFVYEFTLRQSGTYWYHAHQSAQASDGLAGPLIIHSKTDGLLQRLRYASDRVVMLSDHYHHLTSSLMRQYLAPDMENVEPIPDGALINGRGVRDCDELAGRRCDSKGLTNASFLVEKGQSHRLRIIHIGAFAEFQFQIDEHELAVAEVDGTEVEPRYYHRLNISPAQRYSVVINANQTHRSSFRMRARMVKGCFAGVNRLMKNDVEGVVSYEPDDAEPPESKDWDEILDVECRDMNTTELIPLDHIEAPPREDALYYLRTNFQIRDYRLSRGYFNESTWKSNVTSPSLTRFLDGSLAESDVPAGSPPHEFADGLTVETTGIKVIDVLIHNTDDGNHPIHLHGYKYFVMASGQGYPPRKSLLDGVSRETVQPIYDKLDLSNPLRRDTASVDADGWMLIRFVADNPGAWALHCHISWHSDAGLMMQFITRSDVLKTTKWPAANKALCAASVEELEKGSGPKDEDFYAEALEGSSRNGSGCEGESVNDCSYK